MLKSSYQPELSPYSDLHDILITQDHPLRRFNELVDSSFAHDELKEKYCLIDGRNAANPIMLFKYLLLQALHPQSDEDLVSRSMTDLPYKYFLGLNPENTMINPSLLNKFRRQRLKDIELMNTFLKKSTQLANEQGIIQGKTIIVDATHTLSRFTKNQHWKPCA